MTNLVPYTDVVYLSSPSFNYDFWDRRAFYRKKKPLPPKPGSFQVFLKGFKDASAFLKQHPWPDQTNTNVTAPADRNRRTRWADDCRLGSAESDDDDIDGEQRVGRAEAERRKHFWSPALQESFREELDKLVILDYIMRNTDRGLDNWMIRIDQDNEEAMIVADVPKKQNTDEPYAARKDSMTVSTNGNCTGSGTMQEQATPQVMLGAIDNSLAWPWKHPDAVGSDYVFSSEIVLTVYSGEASPSVGYSCQSLSLDSLSRKRPGNISSHSLHRNNGGVTLRLLCESASARTTLSTRRCSLVKLQS